MNGRVKPQNFQWQRIPFLEFVEQLSLIQIESTTAILTVKLKIKLNQQIALVVSLVQWPVVFVILLVKLAVRLFSGQNAIHLHTVFTQQSLFVVIADT